MIGSSPVRICRAKKGSIAELHNLQKDVAILAIDSRDVSRCTSVEVSSIIRLVMVMMIMAGEHTFFLCSCFLSCKDVLLSHPFIDRLI